MSNDEKLLSIAETSKLLDKPEVTIKRYAREKLIPNVQVNGSIMFAESAVMKYLEITKRLK